VEVNAMNEATNPRLCNPEMQEYFSTLPIFIKESIEQSGVKFESVDDLRAFVNNLNRTN
jgi:hypothetical protein